MRRVHFVLMALLVGSSVLPAFALHTTTAKPHHYHHRLRRMRLIHWNPVFRGTHEALIRENAQLDMLQLPRIENDDQLLLLEQSEELVPLRESNYLSVAQNLAETRRYCRPWTRDFVEDFSQDFYKEFHRPIEVTSAVRTVQQQHKLRRHNRNAAPELGDAASTHLTGVTIDILKRGLTRKQMQWVNAYFTAPARTGPDRAGRRASPTRIPHHGVVHLQRMARTKIGSRAGSAAPERTRSLRHIPQHRRTTLNRIQQQSTV